jgi:hypothetical protein
MAKTRKITQLKVEPNKSSGSNRRPQWGADSKKSKTRKIRKRLNYNVRKSKTRKIKVSGGFVNLFNSSSKVVPEVPLFEFASNIRTMILKHRDKKQETSSTTELKDSTTPEFIEMYPYLNNFKGNKSCFNNYFYSNEKYYECESIKIYLYAKLFYHILWLYKNNMITNNDKYSFLTIAYRQIKERKTKLKNNLLKIPESIEKLFEGIYEIDVIMNTQFFNEQGEKFLDEIIDEVESQSPAELQPDSQADRQEETQ